MNQTSTNLDQKIEVSRAEYTALKEMRDMLKKQSALLRVLEAEENLRKGAVSRVSFGTFLKSLSV